MNTHCVLGTCVYIAEWPTISAIDVQEMKLINYMNS